MLTRVRAALVVVILAIATLVALPTAAQAADGVYCESTGTVSVCYSALSAAPSDPVGADANGWTRGAATCYYLTTENNAKAMGMNPEDIYVLSTSGGYTQWYFTIECGNSQKYWSNDRQCYVSMVDGAWPAIPPGYDADAGYYNCNSVWIAAGSGGIGIGDDNYTFWSNSVPPGLQVLTPGRAAAMLIDSFPLVAIDIGMAPEINPAWGHRRGYVGVPLWLWVNNPTPTSWGPYSQTATLGGQTITATAQVTSIRWTMGDGSSTACGNTGTPYNIGYGMTTSPTCGYQYTRTSSTSPGDRFTVTATSSWTVTWTSVSGAAGTVNTTTSSAVDLEVNELQTVIVP